MDIEYVFKTVNQAVYLKSTICRYGNSLKRGKYFLFGGFRAMAHNSYDTIERADVYFNKSAKKRRSKVISFLNKSGFLYNSCKRSSEEYDAIYTANNYDKKREIKLFSFKNRKILTVCTSENEKEKQIDLYELLCKAYNMPSVSLNSLYPASYEISMVDVLPEPEDSMALAEIARSTARFSFDTAELETVAVRKLIEFGFENQEMNELLEKLASRIDNRVLEDYYPLCLQHGDLSKENLMYGMSEGKEGFWWIDWEHLGARVFFYDYFFYVLNSAMYFDDEAYRCYINGKSDDVLAEFFAHFGLTFDSKKRTDYFLVFAIVFLKERVCEIGNFAALKKYCDFILKVLNPESKGEISK